MSRISLDRGELEEFLTAKTAEVAAEPDYVWPGGFKSYRTDEEGRPLVRIGLANFSPDLDIWADLRNPAQVGCFPLAPADIWSHYAANNVQRTRPDGSPFPLAMPETFDQARQRFRRVVLISGMLAVNPMIHQSYFSKIEEGDPDPYDYYARATTEVAGIIDKAVAKLALALMEEDRAVVPMTTKGANLVIERTRSEYQKDRFHGPCNNNWPQNSVAVMTGLLRFGLNRLPFRDETGSDGRTDRLFGRYRSIVIFDGAEPRADESAGLRLLDPEELGNLFRTNDYTRVDQAAVAARYCTYNLTRNGGQSVCGRCLEVCPSQALPNSSPTPDGAYPSKVKNQGHRFWDEALDFDYQNCTSDRFQKAQIYEDYVCARCETVCAVQGIRKSEKEIRAINEVG